MNKDYDDLRNETEQIEARLWDYIDGLGNAAENSEVERLIAERKEWRAKYDELLDLHATVTITQLDEPSMRFTKNVMEEIAKSHISPATRSYINNKVIWTIAAFFITIITGFAIYGFARADWSSEWEEKTGVDITGVDYIKVFDGSYVNLFIMINIVLGLLLFDRYLNNKKKKLVKDL